MLNPISIDPQQAHYLHDTEHVPTPDEMQVTELARARRHARWEALSWYIALEVVFTAFALARHLAGIHRPRAAAHKS